MAGNLYENALWVSQGDPATVNEQATDPGQNPDPGATKQFVAGQLGKKISLTDPTNSGALVVKEYQYVLRDDSTTLNTVPCILKWSDPAVNFTVELSDGAGAIAGVFLGNDSTTPKIGMQDGNFGYIQTGGVINVQCSGSVSAGGDLTSTSNGLAVARTAFTEPLLGIALGTSSSNKVAVKLTLSSVD